MKLNREELKYLSQVLSTTSSFTIAKGEQVEHVTVSHKQIEQKINDEIYRLSV
jgi:hypothetical protein